MNSDEKSSPDAQKPLSIPPLPSISTNMPPIYVFPPPLPPQDQINNYSKFSFTKSAQDENILLENFSPADDLVILRAVRLFYGTNFNGKINNSFWQVFKKSTDSEHSIAALGRHWNMMSKRYNIKEVKIDECISKAMSEAEKLSYSNRKNNGCTCGQNGNNSSNSEHNGNNHGQGLGIGLMGNGMVHAKSHQGLPPEFEQLVNNGNSNNSSNNNGNNSSTNNGNNNNNNGNQQNSTQRPRLGHVNTARPNGAKVLSFEAPTTLLRNQSTPLSRTSKKLTVFPSFPETSVTGVRFPK